MMMDWNGGSPNWGAWIVMGTFLLAFWGLAAWVAVTLVRNSARPGAPGHPGPDEILAERFARGEIDDEEFRRRREALRH